MDLRFFISLFSLTALMTDVNAETGYGNEPEEEAVQLEEIVITETSEKPDYQAVGFPANVLPLRRPGWFVS